MSAHSLRLYELADAYDTVRALLDAVEIDPERQAALQDALDAITDDIERKTDGIAAIIAERRAEEQALDAEIDRLTRRRDARKADQVWLKSYLQGCLESAGIDKVKGARFTVWTQANSQPSVTVAEGAEEALLLAGYAEATVSVKVRCARDVALARRALADALSISPVDVEVGIRVDRGLILEAVSTVREECGDGQYPDALEGLVTVERGRHLRIR